MYLVRRHFSSENTRGGKISSYRDVDKLDRKGVIKYLPKAWIACDQQVSAIKKSRKLRELVESHTMTLTTRSIRGPKASEMP